MFTWQLVALQRKRLGRLLNMENSWKRVDPKERPAVQTDKAKKDMKTTEALGPSEITVGMLKISDSVDYGLFTHTVKS